MSKISIKVNVNVNVVESTKMGNFNTNQSQTSSFLRNLAQTGGHTSE
jgi:hypothetical protein